MKSGYINIAALDKDAEQLLEYCLSIQGQIARVFPNDSSPLPPKKHVADFEEAGVQDFTLHFDGDGWSEGERSTVVRPNMEFNFQGLVCNDQCARLPLSRIYCSAIFMPNKAIKTAWSAIRKYLKNEWPLYTGGDSPVRVHLGKEAGKWLTSPNHGLLIYEPDYVKLNLPRPAVKP